MKTILVGCGNMGFAMLKGWLDKGILAPVDVHVVEPTDALRQRASALSVNAHDDASALPANLVPDIIVVAVKPQVFGDVLQAYKRFAPHAAFVSVAAGITVRSMSEILGAQTAIMRVMPNTPSAVGAGMMVMYANQHLTPTQANHITAMMQASGEVATIDDEALMDAVTGLSGSGPAYVFHMIEAMRDAGIAAGLPEPIAAQLARQTVYGSAIYATKSDEAPGTLREQVTSPNGTTAAALAVLMDAQTGLTPLMTKAVLASRDRSKELGA
ncbi:MAG: pyrroline-5-carboxylate reductase [Ahrensia sp.]